MLRPGITRVFRLPLRRSEQIARELREELEQHYELTVEALVQQGLAPDAAHAEARRRLGGSITDLHRRLYGAARRREDHMRLRDATDALLLDLRYALRQLRRAPAFSLLVICTFALGIGANAAMFGIIDRLLLQGPRHVVDADRIVRLYLSAQPSGQDPTTESTLGYVTYTDVRDGTKAFAQMAAYTRAGPRTLGRGSELDRVRVQYSTWTLFPLLGVQPQLGRFFGPEEDRPPEVGDVVVLSHGAWQVRFGGDPSMLGRTLVVEGRPFTVIGVAPEGFTGPELEPVDLWMPIGAQQRSDTWPTTRRTMWLQIIGRLRPGVTAEQAGVAATLAHQRAYDGSSDWVREGRLSARPLHFDIRGQEILEVAVSRWLLGVAAVVLLIACANVANLLLARALGRRREVAVRLALGVSRGRLVRLLLVEGLVLALAGGAAALLVAWWGGGLIRTTLLPDIAWTTSPVNGRVLAFTAAATVATGLLVSLLPALRASRTRLTMALKEGSRQAGGYRSRLRTGLTVAQAALSVLLLVGAALFVRSLWNVRSLDLGIEADRVLTVALSWQPLTRPLAEAERAREIARRQSVRERVTTELQAMPNVESVAWSIGTPFYSAMGVSVRLRGRDSLPQLPGGGPFISAVSSDYFATAGTDILRGRAFGPGDRAGSEAVAIVNETMAQTLWPGQDPLGRCLLIGDDERPPCARVVGVAEDARRFQLREDAAMQYYVPLGQETGIGGALLLVRPLGDAAAFAEPLRRALHRMDPTFDYLPVRLLQENVEPQVRPWRLGATLFAAFGVLAMLVAAVGLYSVMSYVAAQRMHEMGVRVALGARARDVRRLILRQGVSAAGAGVAIGVGLALAGSRFFEPLLFDTSPRSPALFLLVAAVMLGVAVLASLVPAWRAMRADPTVALRTE